MKTILITIVSVSITISALGQQPLVDYPDSGFTNKSEAKNIMINGMKEGKWIEYRVNPLADSWYCLIVYKEDKPFGIERDYEMDGKIRSMCFYKEGKKNGIGKYYYDSGSLFWEIPYTNDKENGMGKFYDKKSGKIFEEIIFKNGKKRKDIMVDSIDNKRK